MGEARFECTVPFRRPEEVEVAGCRRSAQCGGQDGPKAVLFEVGSFSMDPHMNRFFIYYKAVAVSVIMFENKGNSKVG